MLYIAFSPAICIKIDNLNRDILISFLIKIVKMDNIHIAYFSKFNQLVQFDLIRRLLPNRVKLDFRSFKNVQIVVIVIPQMGPIKI